jgi:hypothetical protein
MMHVLTPDCLFPIIGSQRHEIDGVVRVTEEGNEHMSGISVADDRHGGFSRHVILVGSALEKSIGLGSLERHVIFSITPSFDEPKIRTPQSAMRTP